MTALRSHYSLDMIASVIFAHYMFIIAERYSYIVDWYVFGMPLSKRLASNNLHHEGLENGKSSSDLTILSKNGSVGSYFITCKNCKHPMSNYMLNEECVNSLYHYPVEQPDDIMREGGQ